MSKVENLHVYWNNINKLSKLELDNEYKGNMNIQYFRFYGQLLKREGGGSHIWDMEILLSLIKWGITPNSSMIKPSNISVEGNHQSWIHKIAKGQYRKAHTLEIKWPSKMKDWCVLRIHIWIHSAQCRLPPIYILYLGLIITHREGERKKRRPILIPCMVILHCGLPIGNVSHTVRYWFNEQQVLWKL